MTRTFYVGIYVAKDKVDVSTTEDGKNIISNATFNNNLEGFKKFNSWT